MRVFTLEEETLSHFLFSTMGKRALLGAAGVLAAVAGVYYLYQQYPTQPEQKPETPHTPQSPEQTRPTSLPQHAAQQNNVDSTPADDSTHTMARLKERQPSPHTDPSIQVQAQPPAPLTDEKSTWFLTSASTFHPQPQKKPANTDAHTTDDPHDKDALLVEHGPNNTTQPTFR